MHIKTLVMTLFLVPGSSFSQSQEHGHQHAHEHQHEPSTKSALTLNQGKKWETDAPLREGMASIRRIAGSAAEKPTPEANQRAAKQMNDEIQKIFKNCKLNAKADAMLHLILADLMGSIASLNDPKGASGESYAKIGKALDHYGQYFDHPGWEGNGKK
jgi:hypothetical protein